MLDVHLTFTLFSFVLLLHHTSITISRKNIYELRPFKFVLSSIVTVLGALDLVFESIFGRLT